ncbi:MAG: mobile mystery protein A [Candidatus Obscuribacterales bacterium]|jgi:predicted DNA-binding mobile mystery protein A
MNNLTSKLRRRQLDDKLARFRELERMPRGYIREIRESLEMTTYRLAEKMGISQPALVNIELSERNGTISLKSLEKAAAALGCKVVYALVPDVSLEQIVAEQSKSRAARILDAVTRTMALEQQAASKSANEMLLEELAQDVLRKGKRELWRND